MKIGKIEINKDFNMTFWMFISALLYSFGIVSFSKAGGLYPGGFAGISRIAGDILYRYYHIDIPFGVFFMILNVPVTLLVFRYIGKRFTIYSMMQYILVSVFTSILETPIIKVEDILLMAVFGGIICGFGVGIALRNNASSGGTDFIAIYVSNKYNRPIWNYVMFFNFCVLCIAGILFGWEKALYSIIFQFVQTQVVSKLHERYSMETLTIITQYPEEVTKSILSGTRHGITEVHGTGMFKHQDVEMLYTVVNSFQRRQVVKAVLAADPKAFINIQETISIVGNYYQKPLD